MMTRTEIAKKCSWCFSASHCRNYPSINKITSASTPEPTSPENGWRPSVSPILKGVPPQQKAVCCMILKFLQVLHNRYTHKLNYVNILGTNKHYFTSCKKQNKKKG